MTYYLKYRPQKLDELDLTEVRESLSNIVKSGKIPHAFLFSGPKGTGKTSAARILAKIVNCERRTKNYEPCNRCEQCISITKGNNLDVIELDAASHRGIDDVRSLRDAVKLASAKARKKVYIIDEVHMLTTESSNALLKTLEEPPEHVMFVLATTNPEKLIPTIRSRTTEILFKKASGEEIARSLSRVAKGEKLKVDKETLQIVANFSDGSFRDAVKTLEQIVSEKRPLEKEKIEEYLFQKRVFDIDGFLKILAKKDTKAALLDIERIVSAGGSIENFTTGLLARLRMALLTKLGVANESLSDFSKEELVHLIELFGKAKRDVGQTPIDQLPVEMAVVAWCSGGKKMEDNIQPPDPPSNLQHQNSSVREVTEEIWRKILAGVKPINTSIEALLRAARPTGFDGRTLTLGVFYRFHKERLEDGRNRKILEEVVATVLGVPARVVCILTEPPRTKVKEEKKETSVLTEGGDKDIIKIAEEIFGS